MAYLGRKGASAALTSADIPDGSISAVKVAADVATQAEIDLKANLASPTLTTPNLGTPSAVTLTNATFPAGHIIRSFYAQDDGGEHQIADPSAANSVYSELELTITGTNSTSDYLMVILYLAAIYNDGFYGNTLHTGIMYSTDNWSSPADGTALITDGTDYQMMRSSGIQSGTTAFHMTTSDTLIFRVNHPVTGTYKIRPKFKNNGSSFTINKGHGRSTITAFEIKG